MTPTTPPSRKMFSGERYLRADHLMKGGKFIAVKVKISDVIHGLPAKIMGKDNEDGPGKGTKFMPGLMFEGKDKVLGLNATNESTLCWETGEGNWTGWIGKEILLVVRLVKSYDRQSRGFVDMPCIRIWPKVPHPSGRVRDQMGVEVPDSWYASNRSEYLSGQKQLDEQPKQQEPQKPVENKAPENKPEEFTAETRRKWIEIMEKCIADAKDQDGLRVCRTRFTALGAELDKHKMPLTADERVALSDKLKAATKAIEEKQEQ